MDRKDILFELLKDPDIEGLFRLWNSDTKVFSEADIRARLNKQYDKSYFTPLLRLLMGGSDMEPDGTHNFKNYKFTLIVQRVKEKS